MTHEPLPGGRGVCELRCGTTTQVSRYANRAAWQIAKIQAAVGLRKLPKNSALVHRFSEDAKGRPVVETQLYERSTIGGPFASTSRKFTATF
jgi:hypothetical protein